MIGSFAARRRLPRRLTLGYFDTAEEAAAAYANSDWGRADAAQLRQRTSTAPSAADDATIRQAAEEGLTLTASNNSTGYKSVSFCPNRRGSKKYMLEVTTVGGKRSTCWFATAEEAALFYARREAGRDTSDLTAPPPPPPPPEPSSAAAAEAVRHAEGEGLTLVTSSNNSTGYKYVRFCPNQRGSKKYMLQAKDGGKLVFLGSFASAEQAALFYARREAGRDTSDLTY